MGLSKQLRVWQKSSPLSVLLECRGLSEALLFESDVVAVLSQSEAENIRKLYTKHTDTYCCLGVLRIYFDNHVGLYLFVVTSCDSIGKVQNSEIYRVNAVTSFPLNEFAIEEPVTEVRRLLNSGHFFFARPVSDDRSFIDITLSMQNQATKSINDNRFLWNKGMFGHLERFGVDCSAWTVHIVCGGFEIKTVYAGDRTAKACLFCRLSCDRAGTRFNTRGTDDKGNVANFVEMEQVLFVEDFVSSFVQLRGSVPLFWEQPGFQAGVHKVKMSRGFQASATAFERHFSDLLERYGPQLILNLLGIQEGENLLSLVYENQFKCCCYAKSDSVRYFGFDYHRCKGRAEKMEALHSVCKKYTAECGLFLQEKDQAKSMQNGTIRANCMDCLDRTNSVQCLIGLMVLPCQLEALGLIARESIKSRFEEAFRKLWSVNGDRISRIYAGTGALDSKSKVGKLVDGARSVSRTFQNNFLDSTKQEAINLLLQGNVYAGYRGWRARALLPFQDVSSSPQLVHEMCARSSRYTLTSSLRVAVGTWNVNGGRHFRSIAFKNQSMRDWLLDGPKLRPMGQKIESSMKLVSLKEDEASRSHSSSQFIPIDFDADLDEPVDIYAIGFEELVDLNAGNIISASSTNRKEWCAELERVLSRDEPHVLLTTEQLVGVCLYIFVRPKLLPFIRDVAIGTVKTGLSGKAGNKGAVAVRLLIHSSSLCFVCAHFAAGQSQVANRNQDFLDINKRLTFPMGHPIDCHDYVFWCGDFNYRIDMPLSQVKEIVRDENWKILQAYDQLNVQRQKKAVFQGFLEGRTNFSPTYKYDIFSDDYDTSEKSRVPAWTDRVLWRRLDHRKRASASGGKSVAEDVALIAAAAALKERDPNEAIAAERKWDEGRLLYYNRAELKTSDHRPVLAIVDIEIDCVDEDKRRLVRDDVLLALGPSDPTIVISESKSPSDDGGRDELNSIDPAVMVTAFEAFGEIVLVRLLDGKVFITYGDARSAVAALQFDGKIVEGVTISIRLKSTWPPHAAPRELSPDVEAPAVGSRLAVFTSERVRFVCSPNTSPRTSPQTSPRTVRRAEQRNLDNGSAHSDVSDDDLLEGKEEAAVIQVSLAQPKPSRPPPPSRPTKQGKSGCLPEERKIVVPIIQVEKELLVGKGPVRPPRPALPDKRKPDRPPKAIHSQPAKLGKGTTDEVNERPRRPPRPVCKPERPPPPRTEKEATPPEPEDATRVNGVHAADGNLNQVEEPDGGGGGERLEDSESVPLTQIDPLVECKSVSVSVQLESTENEEIKQMSSGCDESSVVGTESSSSLNPFTAEADSIDPPEELHSPPPESFEDVSLADPSNPQRPLPPTRGRSSTFAVSKHVQRDIPPPQRPPRPRSSTGVGRSKALPPPRPKPPGSSKQ
eukprot:m.30421 g.30421  ORF g.30421 m.30421 type:complete len:1392 (+) comp31341_c0_seq8:2-4177(+)